MSNPYLLTEEEAHTKPASTQRKSWSLFSRRHTEQKMEDQQTENRRVKEEKPENVYRSAITQPSPLPVTLPSDEPIVQVNDVIKSFTVAGKEIEILKGVSLHVQPGEFVSIERYFDIETGRSVVVARYMLPLKYPNVIANPNDKLWIQADAPLSLLHDERLEGKSNLYPSFRQNIDFNRFLGLDNATAPLDAVEFGQQDSGRSVPVATPSATL